MLSSGDPAGNIRSSPVSLCDDSSNFDHERNGDERSTSRHQRLHGDPFARRRPEQRARDESRERRRAKVAVASSGLGRILVDGRGRTLYLFEKDKHGKSACTGQCASFWPPLIASGKPLATAGAKASLLGTTKRADGRLQVTYNHHPLYTFVKDTKKGQTNGEEVDAFGAEWYAISAAGAKVERAARRAAARAAPATTRRHPATGTDPTLSGRGQRAWAQPPPHSASDWEGTQPSRAGTIEAAPT